MKNKRTTSNLTPKIKNILSITIESIVPDLRALVAALYLSTPDEIIRIHQTYPKGNIIFYALNAACEFRSDPALRDPYINDGFFNEQLECLLRVAKKNHVAGARLMPVFCTALNEADELKLPKALQDKIISHINRQRQRDGFAITEMSREKTVVVPADDVLPE